MVGAGLDSCNEPPCNRDDEGEGSLEEDGRKADSCGDGREKGKEEIVHDVIFLLDQRSDPVWPESPKCLHHHQ